MGFPQWFAGSTITAQKLSDMQWQSVIQGGDQTRTSTTTFLATNLVVPVVASASYKYRLLVSYISNDIADIKFNWVVPTNAAIDGRWNWGIGRDAGGSAQVSATHNRHARNSATTQVVVGGTSVDQLPLGYHEEGVITGGDGGNCTFQFAQNTADPFVTTLQAVSRVDYLRIG